ncbi:SIS domain-containing protein [Neobacillus bataviensis]|uniref:SIS domain-containing protein n=1 Tax=Neobacillus bataviensis TaxID=220685 RepID=UPI001CBFDE40|nr:SIS domain-containing protein [Neobacillus bataviensis]
MFASYYYHYKKEFLETIDSLDLDVICKIYETMEEARKNRKQIFLIGNGGSASSASHWACDFVKGVNVGNSIRYKLIALTDNISLITAYGNDVEYEEIFVEQLKNFLNPGDVVIGLSVSGASENIVRAFRYAKDNGAVVISLIGSREGRMKDFSDLSLIISSSNYGVVEDVHMYVNHVISQYIKQTIQHEVTN